MTIPAVRDAQTVTPDGERILDLIDGVRLRRSRTITDARGSLCEMFSHGWDFSDEPVVHVYEAMLRPGVIKGWVIHYESDDRLFFARGVARVVLYDAREGSPTHGIVNELYFDAANRGILRIPCGVIHAVQNIGLEDATFVNMPTRAYDHANPDKYRLPLDSDVVPYRFERA